MTSKLRTLSMLLMALLLSACGIFPESLPVSDARVQSLFAAASAFDRKVYGFTPLPSSGNVRLESRTQGERGYDAMLHLGGKTNRTIAFRKDGSRYFWIGEQESFQGPKEYKTVDGTFREQIVLTFEKERVSGFPLNRLNVSYNGEDARLVDRRNISLDDVKPILREWGY